VPGITWRDTANGPVKLGSDGTIIVENTVLGTYINKDTIIVIIYVVGRLNIVMM
jgi:hypothetical protein